MNRENFKIILSALLVVLLITFGIYVFIFRNEISVQIQQFTRNPDTSRVERMILDPEKKTGTMEEFENKKRAMEEGSADKDASFEMAEKPGDELSKQPGVVMESSPKADENVFPGDQPVTDFSKPLVPAARGTVQKTGEDTGTMPVKTQTEVIAEKKEIVVPKKQYKPGQKTVKKKSYSPKKKKSVRKKKRVSRLTKLEKRVSSLEKKMKIRKTGKSLEKRIYELEKRVNKLEKK